MAQNIPNPNFSDIYIGGLDRLHDWGNSEGCSVGEPRVILQYVTVDYSHPNYAVRLKTKTDTSGNVFPSFLFSSSLLWQYNPGCDENFILTGQPFPYRPDKMLGWYKFWNDSLITNDFGTATVILKKFNNSTQMPDTIGYGTVQLTPTISDSVFEAFEVPITYLQANVIPDSIAVFFYSTGTQQVGGVLTVDSLSFDFSSANRKAILPKKNTYQIRQNPVQNTAFITSKKVHLSQPTNIQLLNLDGKILIETIANHFPFSLNVDDLASGLYFIRIISEEERTVLKMIKQ